MRRAVESGLSCETCEFYWDHQLDAKTLARRAEAGVNPNTGQCRRRVPFVHVNVAEPCGDHSMLADERDRHLAKAIRDEIDAAPLGAVARKALG